MSRIALLNNVDHAQLRYQEVYGSEFGHSVSNVVIYPTEFGDIHREYPIFLRHEKGSNKLVPVALLGFEKEQNLFLSEGQWLSRYVPAVFSKGPFYIGSQKRGIDDEDSGRVIHIDIDDERISEVKGHRIFLEHGGLTPETEHLRNVLNAIHDGIELWDKMLESLTKYDLVEPVDISVSTCRDKTFNLSGYYTLSEEKLMALRGRELEGLHESGFLQGAYMIVSSMNNMKDMINLWGQRSQKVNNV